MSSVAKLTLKINTLDILEELSEVIKQAILSGDIHVLFLDGDLGAGKTTLTKKILSSLGYDKVVSSPTFNIMKEYHFKNYNIYHFDIYRVESEVYDLGFEEIWGDSTAISIIEWSKYLPEEFQNMFDLKISIKLNDENRLFTIEGHDKLIKEIGEEMHEYIY